MNKSRKIALNYALGIALTALLLWSLYHQVTVQLGRVQDDAWKQTGPSWLLLAALLLMPLNLGLETIKWYLLARMAQPLSKAEALKSYLAGIAFSLITPNRIGEYPGRLLYLKRRSTFRLINVSVLGSFAQLLALFLWGSAALLYFCLRTSYWWGWPVLTGCLLMTIGVGMIYLRLESWLPLLERYPRLRKWVVYTRLLGRFSFREQMRILGLSLLRFAVFTAQYLILLRWMNVQAPLAEGYMTAALFFWVMAVIPSIALAELGVRGEVGLRLFGRFSANTIGILGATTGLWCINLLLPALAGSMLLLRMRLLR